MIDAKALAQRLKADNFGDLRGARINAVIPLTEHLLNEIVAQQAEQSGTVKEMSIRIPGANRIVLFVSAKVSALFGIKIPVKKTLEMEIAPEVPLLPSPRLQLHIVKGLSGLEKNLISWLENLISRLVPGDISMEGDTITVDFGSVMRKRGLDDARHFIETVSVDGEPGKLVISASLRIGQTAGLEY